MNTEFGEKLQNAMNSIDSFIWVNKKGESVKMVNMPADELQLAAKHCFEMLYNESSYNVGRLIVRKNIHSIWDSCNAELFARYLLHECNVGFKSRKDILDCINNYRAEYEGDILDQSVSLIFNGLPPVFEKVTIRRLMDACFDKLDIFNRKIINDKFLLYQGIWLTNDEKNDLTEKDENGNMRDRKEVICERLSLKWITPKQLRFTPTGLSYTEFRSIAQMGPVTKISTLPSNTLETLRDKILLLLDNDLDHHINKWNTLLKNCKAVAERRHIPLDLPVAI